MLDEIPFRFFSPPLASISHLLRSDLRSPREMERAASELLIRQYSRINDRDARLKVFRRKQFLPAVYASYLAVCNDRFNATLVIRARNW